MSHGATAIVGVGEVPKYDMERYVRDIVALPMVGGSSNMQKNNIANRRGLPTR
jgi:alkylation response protein AidB-like acyl-CoA dehydrogenase